MCACHQESSRPTAARDGERGWAMLSLLLALSLIAFFLTYSIVPNVKMQVQRDKEAEMIYRGEQMARAIAMYYNNGRLGPIQLQVPPPYGYLTELKKLKEGVSIGVRQIKFVRSSSLIDPMTSQEWEPVRARDPRLGAFFQAYAAMKQVPIPPSYMLLAGAPTRGSIFNVPRPEKPKPPTSTAPGAQTPVPKQPVATDEDEEDDDDDEEDEDEEDPLSHIFQSSDLKSGPIVGVAPKEKGPSVRPLYGLKDYGEWVFIYIPDNMALRMPGRPARPINAPPQVSQ